MGCNASDGSVKVDDSKWNKALNTAADQERQVKKLLLLGPGNSGKSTFFKQLISIHGSGFSDGKLFSHSDVTRAIYDSVIIQMKAIIRQCIEFEYPLDETEQKSADFLADLPRDVEINESISSHITSLWNSESIRDAFAHRTSLGIVDSCPHFFENIGRISKSDYIPSEKDILLVRTPTTGVVSSRFNIDNHPFLIFDVGGQRSERNKWIHCFDSVTAVLFVASMSCYDQALFELDYVNAMHEALNLFDEIVNSRWFRRTSIVLFLNKSDLFKQKILRKKLTICFPDFDGQENNAEEGIEFIRAQFLKRNETNKTRQVYSHITCATDRDNVERVFNDVQHMIVNASLQRGGLL